MQAVTDAALKHRRMGHLNRKILELLENQNHIRVSFYRIVPERRLLRLGE